MLYTIGVGVSMCRGGCLYYIVVVMFLVWLFCLVGRALFGGYLWVLSPLFLGGDFGRFSGYFYGVNWIFL